MLTAIHKKAMREGFERVEQALISKEIALVSPEQEQADSEAEQQASNERLLAISIGLGLANDLAGDLIAWWDMPDSTIGELAEVIEPVMAKHQVETPSWLAEFKEELKLVRVVGAIGIEMYGKREQYLEEQRAKNAKQVNQPPEGAEHGGE